MKQKSNVSFQNNIFKNKNKSHRVIVKCFISLFKFFFTTFSLYKWSDPDPQTNRMDPDPQQTFYYKEQIVWMLFFYNTYGWLKVVHSRWERTSSFIVISQKCSRRNILFIQKLKIHMTKENPYFMEMLTSQLYILLLPLLVRKLKWKLCELKEIVLVQLYSLLLIHFKKLGELWK